MRNYLQLINLNTGGPRCDVTPIFRNPQAFEEMVDDFYSLSKDIHFELVAGIDALGFILGTALAIKFKKGFVAIRKGGKLPVEVDRVSFTDYTGLEKTLELEKKTITKGQRILLVDEWIETGAQAKAAIQLVKDQGGEIVGLLTIHMDQNTNTQSLIENYRCIGLNLVS